MLFLLFPLVSSADPLPAKIPHEAVLEIANAQLVLQNLILRVARQYQFDPDAGDDVNLQTGVITRKIKPEPSKPTLSTSPARTPALPAPPKR